MPNTLFSTYSQGENRVTGTILAVLERLSFALVEQILQALLQEPEAQLVTFRNQVRGEASVPDARIRASFSYWIETKTERRAVSERQLRAHLLALDAEPAVDRQRLLVLTPDDAVPEVVSAIGDPRLGWASFSDLVAAIEQALELDEGWITSEQAIPSERERELLRELVHFLVSAKLVQGEGHEVLVVPARVALAEYLELGLYMCQPGRTFRPASHLAFYANGRIDPHVPAVLGSEGRVTISEAGVREVEGLEEELRAQLLAVVRRLEAEASARLGLEQKVLFLSAPDAPETVRLGQAIENDPQVPQRDSHRHDAPHAAPRRPARPAGRSTGVGIGPAGGVRAGAALRALERARGGAEDDERAVGAGRGAGGVAAAAGDTWAM